MALENALAYSEVRRQEAMLVQLGELSAAMYAVTTRETLTEVLATKGKRVVGAHRLQVIMLELPMSREVAQQLSPASSPREPEAPPRLNRWACVGTG